MSFQNQGFCVAKGTGTINDGEYDGGSRIDHKRSHQWYMDGQEADVFPNKKQATGIPSNNFFTGMINSNISPWGSASSFRSMSSHFADRLFDSETARTANFDERDMPSVSEEKVDMERKLADGQFSNNPLFGLSISSALEDPRSGLNYGGIRKVKVSQVKESETAMPASLEHSYNAMENSAVSVTNAYSKADENNLSMGLAYNEGDGCIMSIGNPYERDNNIFISMGQPYNKGDDGASITQAYNASDDNVSMSHTFSKGDDGFISMGQNYNKADENGISMAHVYSKGHDATISITQGDSNSVPIVQSYSKGESTMISFGSGYDDDDDDTNPSGRLISSYDLMMAQPSLETSAVINDKRLPKSNLDGNALVGHAVTSGIDDASKRKEDLKTSKKVPANSFPSNVRSLLSTGMLDGVPVKYIAWSREKELRGIIKGSGYLCGCQTCNFSKVINAYEFERHANCKTKHPNNHIYFENRKTIYGIVQELRSTPQNMLFDVIQTITGSPINLKSFRIWKESFLAATRELQRIYGKDEGKPL